MTPVREAFPMLELSPLGSQNRRKFLFADRNGLGTKFTSFYVRFRLIMTIGKGINRRERLWVDFRLYSCSLVSEDLLARFKCTSREEKVIKKT